MPTFVSLSETAALIPDSCRLALGGMTVYRRPVVFVREVLRRQPRPQDLTLVCFTAGIESDMLVGAGCVSRVHSVYFGLESFGLAPMFTNKANRGEIEIVEETEMSFILGIRAAIANVGFLPSPAWVGTGLPALRPDVKLIRDPYTGETLTAFPALPVDVAVLHALEADSIGNIKLNNNLGIDPELVYAANTVIVTVERMVKRVEKSTDGMIIPAPGISYIALAPLGALPTSCHPLYPLRGRDFFAYIEACNAGTHEFETFVAGS